MQLVSKGGSLIGGLQVENGWKATVPMMSGKAAGRGKGGFCRPPRHDKDKPEPHAAHVLQARDGSHFWHPEEGPPICHHSCAQLKLGQL